MNVVGLNRNVAGWLMRLTHPFKPIVIVKNDVFVASYRGTIYMWYDDNGIVTQVWH